jgi:phosphoribosylanthranilate isomerase
MAVANRDAHFRFLPDCGTAGGHVRGAVDIAARACDPNAMVEVKICGLRTADALDTALAEGADYVGLVFFPPSPRHLTLPEGAALASRARGRARVVALTVDATAAEIEAIVAAVKPDVLQLHGLESAEAAAALRQKAGAVWKAVPVSDAGDVQAGLAAYPAVDRLLFDAHPPAGATRPGGNARRFDWGLLAGLDLARPFVLSGGLDAGNVAEAIRVSGAATVDVSSGVERAPGVKDPALIRAFIRAARTAAAAPAET